MKKDRFKRMNDEKITEGYYFNCLIIQLINRFVLWNLHSSNAKYNKEKKDFKIHIHVHILDNLWVRIVPEYFRIIRAWQILCQMYNLGLRKDVSSQVLL